MIRALARQLTDALAGTLTTSDGVSPYILRATFTADNASLSDAQAMGAGDGVEQGSLTVGLDTGTADIIAGSQLRLIAGAGFDDYLVAPAVTRQAGLALVARVRVSTNTGDGIRIGFSTSATDFAAAGNLSAILQADQGTGIQAIEGGGGGYTGDPTTAWFDCAVVLGGYDENDEQYTSGDASTFTYGALFLAKPIDRAEWQVVGRYTSDNTETLYPFIAAAGDTVLVDSISIPSTADPSLLTTGLAFPASYTLPISFTGYADGFLSFLCVPPSSGNVRVDFRRQDANNFWRLDISSTGDLLLIEVTAGTPTTRGALAKEVAGTGAMVYCAHYGNDLFFGTKGGSEASYTSSQHAAQTGVYCNNLGVLGQIYSLSDTEFEIIVAPDPNPPTGNPDAAEVLASLVDWQDFQGTGDITSKIKGDTWELFGDGSEAIANATGPDGIAGGSVRITGTGGNGLRMTTDDDDFDVADTDHWWTCGVYVYSESGSRDLFLKSTDWRFRIAGNQFFADGPSSVVATGPSSMIAVWKIVTCWRQADTNKVYMDVDGIVYESAATGTPVGNTVEVSVRGGGGLFGVAFARVGFGRDAYLSDGARAYLRNSNQGRKYADIISDAAG